MTSRERLNLVLNGGMPGDRLPMIEWAAWWDKTLDRWQQEGMPSDLTWSGSLQYFGLDELYNISAAPDVPPAPGHGTAAITGEADYERLLERLYAPSIIERLLETARSLKPRHDAGEMSIRLWLDGFFWYPRRLFGIEPHLYAFYDYPEFIMMGGYDKMVMNQGEEAMRAEFERLLPVMRSGRYIPSVDHQTPPGVSFSDYKTYIELFQEYCERAVKTR
jgi:hypothetical protein